MRECRILMAHDCIYITIHYMVYSVYYIAYIIITLRKRPGWGCIYITLQLDETDALEVYLQDLTTATEYHVKVIAGSKVGFPDDAEPIPVSFTTLDNRELTWHES